MELEMQIPTLSPQEIAVISKALDTHIAQKGDHRILGAKLGSIISSAIKPKFLREFGGMRRVVVTSLSDLIYPVPPAPADFDLVFEIKKVREVQALNGNEIPVEPQVVAGVNLWRLFANPNLPVDLIVSADNNVYAQKQSEPDLVPLGGLIRPSTDDYRKLAEVFAIQEQEPIRSALQAVLTTADFYNNWINSLKTLRTSSNNLLKRWEILRSEFVASELNKSLVAAGVDIARAAEIVAAARPVVPMHASQAHPPSPKTTSNPIVENRSTYGSDELVFLRDILRDAIERMSLSELRELRVPLGSLFQSVAK